MISLSRMFRLEERCCGSRKKKLVKFTLNFSDQTSTWHRFFRDTATATWKLTLADSKGKRGSQSPNCLQKRLNHKSDAPLRRSGHHIALLGRQYSLKQIDSKTIQAPVVQRLDNAIHRINHYPADSVVCFLTLIHWIAIYPVDSVIQPLNNWGIGQHHGMMRVTSLIWRPGDRCLGSISNRFVSPRSLPHGRMINSRISLPKRLEIEPRGYFHAKKVGNALRKSWDKPLYKDTNLGVARSNWTPKN